MLACFKMRRSLSNPQPALDGPSRAASCGRLWRELGERMQGTTEVAADLKVACVGTDTGQELYGLLLCWIYAEGGWLARGRVRGPNGWTVRGVEKGKRMEVVVGNHAKCEMGRHFWAPMSPPARRRPTAVVADKPTLEQLSRYAGRQKEAYALLHGSRYRQMHPCASIYSPRRYMAT